MLRKFRSSSSSSSLHCNVPGIAVLPALSFTCHRTYFVRHRKTPNPDCMMFHVSNFNFRIGSQEKLASYLQERDRQQRGISSQEEEDDDDWDGPGVIKNAAKRHEQDEKRKEDNAKRAQELRRRHLRAYLTRSSQETFIRDREAEQLASAQAEAEGKIGDMIEPACESAPDFDFELSSSSPATRAASAAAAAEKTATAAAEDDKEEEEKPCSPLDVPSRSGGAGVISAASRPKRTSSSPSSAAPSAAADGEESSPTEQFQPDIDDEAARAAGITVISATFSFANEEKHLSPLAKRIYESEAGSNVAEVVVGSDFVTVRRKSDEELEEEFEAEQERKRLAEERGEKDHPSHEAVVTSLGTLTDMVKKPTSGTSAASAAAASNPAAETRERLAEMYRESDENKRLATEEKQKQEQQQQSSAIDGAKTGTLNLPVEEEAKAPTAANWFDLLFELSGAVTDHLYFNEVAVDLGAKHPHSDTEIMPEDSEIVGAIKELISEHLRPLLQSDGGDIKYVSFDDGSSVLSVEMLGSCKTCKKSDTTLRDLIERTVQHFVPEVKEVQEIAKMKRLKQQQQLEEERGQTTL